jgi:transglutaminase-like putative cysteine protease
MTILTVRHITRYRYAKPVSFGEHRMMFRPRESYDQRLIETRVKITPEPADVRYYHDVFGNTIGVVRFDKKAKELLFDSRNKLEHLPEETLDDPSSPERNLNTFPFVYPQLDLPDLLSSIQSQFDDPGGVMSEWSRRFLHATERVDAFSVLSAMTKAIHTELEYVHRASGPPQTPLETLKHGSGTCRDFAVLMLEATRMLGLAARFVSGYLYSPNNDTSEARRRGGGNTHAWVRIYMPGGGWVEFDPTNGLVGNRDLIRVTIARDPAQALPLSGTWNGNPADYLGMDVKVDVRAESETQRRGRGVMGLH